MIEGKNIMNVIVNNTPNVTRNEFVFIIIPTTNSDTPAIRQAVTKI